MAANKTFKPDNYGGREIPERGDSVPGEYL